MSIDFFATKIEGETSTPVFDLNAHARDIVAEDADARVERGEDAFIPNPDFVEDSGVNMANGNAYRALEAIGILEAGAELPMEFPIADVLDGIAAWRPVAFDGGDMRFRLEAIRRICVKGQAAGGTHLVAC